jgi:hypothetical protein
MKENKQNARIMRESNNSWYETESEELHENINWGRQSSPYNQNDSHQPFSESVEYSEALFSRFGASRKKRSHPETTIHNIWQISSQKGGTKRFQLT